MKVRSIVLGAVASVALCFGIAQMGSANDVASSEFSSMVAANSYANSGDMNANISVENQYADYKNSGEKLEFAASLSCSTGCTRLCTTCCTHKCGL